MRESLASSLRSGLALALAGLACAALLAGAYTLTRARIGAQQQQAQLDALTTVLPKSLYDNDPLRDRVLVSDPALGTTQPMPVYRARHNGRPAAVVIEAVAPHGYGGPITLLIGIDRSGEITGVRVLEHHETPGLGDLIEADKSDWITRFAGKSLGKPPANQWAVKKDGGVFDQFAGATITPRAVVEEVQRVLVFFQANQEKLFARPRR